VTLLLIATRNQHKLDEFRHLLGPRFRYRSLADFANSPQVVEDADTFAGNAAKKAESLAAWLARHPDAERARAEFAAAPMLVLADDSGLEVDALNGAPGVHSARFAALDTGAPGNSDDAANNAKLLRLLAEVPALRRTGRFRCVLALTRLDAAAGNWSTDLFEGRCEGRIGFEPEGRGGFGYDPLFYPDGYTKSFATLGRAVKSDISHRARALAALRQHLR
jgi:XTP/dITP diphosphohydrolase